MQDKKPGELALFSLKATAQGRLNGSPVFKTICQEDIRSPCFAGLAD